MCEFINSFIFVIKKFTVINGFTIFSSTIKLNKINSFMNNLNKIFYSLKLLRNNIKEK